MSVLLYGFNDRFFFSIARKLLEQKLPVSHIVTMHPHEFSDPVFRQVTIIDQHNLSYIQSIRRLNTKSDTALSDKIIEELFETESLFLSVTDRLAFFPQSVRSRKEVYYELLQFWLDFLKKESITTIIFTQTPHDGSPNILYGVAHSQKVRTLFIYPTIIQDSVLLLHDYKKIEKIPRDFKKGASINSLSKEIGSTLVSQVFATSEWLKKSFELNTQANSHKSFISMILRIIKRNLNFSSLSHLLKKSLSFNSIAEGTIFYLEKPIHPFFEYILVIKHYLHILSLEKLYISLSQTPRKKEKFVYFPLQYQPERTTMPEGGVFCDQLLALDILSKSIPKGWYVYVKEHPRQFVRTDIRLHHFRDKHYYAKIRSYKNVKLISLDEESRKLIKNAQFTATVTGSAGWESLQFKKACMVFGYAWYSGCNSCYKVGSVEDCRKAIQDIHKKGTTNVELDVLKFLLYYKKRFITSSHSEEIARRSSLPFDELAVNICEAYKKHVV